jgi:hypothetical protein
VSDYPWFSDEMPERREIDAPYEKTAPLLENRSKAADGNRYADCPECRKSVRFTRSEQGWLTFYSKECRCHPDVILNALSVLENRRKPEKGGKAARRPIEGHTAAAIVAMVLPDPKWAIPGILCEGLNILAGGQKLGKSWLALSVCIAIASGGRALGKIEVLQGDVLYLALEDTLRRLQDRLLKLMQGEVAPERLTIYTEWPRLDEAGLEWLRKWLTQHPEARLVVIDTLKKIRPPRSKNGSVYDEDYDFMGELKRLADEFEVAFLVLHHVRKASAEDVFDTVSGSIGLTGAADATLVLTRSRGKKEGLLHLTGRDVEEQADEDAMALEWDVDTGCWTLTGKVASQMVSGERQQIIEVLETLARPLSPKEIADMLNKNPSTTRTLLQKMTNQGQISCQNGVYTASTHNTVDSVDSVDRGDWLR